MGSQLVGVDGCRRAAAWGHVIGSGRWIGGSIVVEWSAFSGGRSGSWGADNASNHCELINRAGLFCFFSAFVVNSVMKFGAFHGRL